MRKLLLVLLAGVLYSYTEYAFKSCHKLASREYFHRF